MHTLPYYRVVQLGQFGRNSTLQETCIRDFHIRVHDPAGFDHGEQSRTSCSESRGSPFFAPATLLFFRTTHFTTFKNE